MDNCGETLLMDTIAVSNPRFSDLSRFSKPQNMGNMLSYNQSTPVEGALQSEEACFPCLVAVWSESYQ